MNSYLDRFYTKKSDPNLNFIYIEDLSESFSKQFSNFDQLTINDYSPGDGIPPHTDSHSPFEDVISLILFINRYFVP
jgi:alkylated DNA repair dioxygenase AlkB